MEQLLPRNAKGQLTALHRSPSWILGALLLGRGRGGKWGGEEGGRKGRGRESGSEGRGRRRKGEGERREGKGKTLWICFPGKIS